MDHQVKTTLDASAALVTGATLLGWLPWVAALITSLYGIMCMIIAWPKFTAQLRKWFP